MLTELDAEAVFALALNAPVLLTGGNSTVRRVTYAGRDLAVKDYSSRSDGRARQEQEFAALQLVHPEFPTTFAEPVAVSPDGLRAIQSWLLGARPALDSALVTGMLQIAADLHDLAKRLPKGRGLAATDQVLAPHQLTEQIQHRLQYLAGQAKPINELAIGQVLPALTELTRPDTALAPPSMTLSLSDFGPHNLLWEASSSDLRCVDLEFFGWDDAHKLTLDTLLHPLTDWTPDTASQFTLGALEVLTLDECRLLALFAPLSLKWSTITLARAARDFARGDELAAASALDRTQWYLTRARSVPASTGDIVALVTRG